MMPIDGRISGSLIFQNCDQPVMPSHLGRLDHLVGDREQRGVDQHHRDADELPDRDQRQRGQRVFLLAEPGREQRTSGRPRRACRGATPQIGDRISFQTKPTMTKDRIVGTKIAVR